MLEVFHTQCSNGCVVYATYDLAHPIEQDWRTEETN